MLASNQFNLDAGGAEPRQAQLGASERRAPRSDYRRGLGEQGSDEDAEGHRGGQEAPCRCKFYEVMASMRVGTLRSQHSCT